jgi:hypothetical protein
MIQGGREEVTSAALDCARVEHYACRVEQHATPSHLHVLSAAALLKGDNGRCAVKHKNE